MSLAAQDHATQTPRRARRITATWLAVNGVTLAALAAWWFYARQVPLYIMPGPALVASRMIDPALAGQLATSLAHVAAALAISFVIGGALAFTSHYARVTRLLIEGRITPFLNAFAGIGWLFLAILWFGANSVTVIFAVTMVLLPFAAVNLGAGLQEMNLELIELGRSLTRDRLRRFRLIILPMLLPYVFATLRASFGLGWKIVLTAELFGGNAGVGYVLNVARQELETETILAIILWIVVIVGMAEAFIFRPLQARLDRRFADA